MKRDVFKPFIGWLLEDGVSIVRSLQNVSRQFNYHVCLGGGVLNNGYSYNDLDLYFLPLNTEDDNDADGLVTYLEKLWGPAEDLVSEEYLEGSMTYERKLKFVPKVKHPGKRIEVFVVRG